MCECVPLLLMCVCGDGTVTETGEEKERAGKDVYGVLLNIQILKFNCLLYIVAFLLALI